jgi:hypothetical protein
MTRIEQREKSDEIYKKGLTGKKSMLSTVKRPQNRKFTFSNHSGGKS